METSLDQALRLYDYDLPSELIAQEPANPRDSSKLLVFNRATQTTEWAHFRDVGRFLPAYAVLVLNETKVIPAKLSLTRSDGRSVEALYLGMQENTIRVLIRGTFRPGDILTAPEGQQLDVLGRDGKELLLNASFDIERMQRILQESGRTPLPPYIDHSPLTESQLRDRYQSVFAKEGDSVAAPTASLHFTPELLRQIEAQGISIVRLSLHVHLGTFAPLTEEQWKTGKLHRERYEISTESVQQLEAAKRSGRPIVAVGTTAARTLESAFDALGHCIQSSGMTDLFIREGYAWKMVDHLITNFHVPRSSLLMLVSAFAGREKVFDLYKQAMERKFRFFSFGDAMLIL